jgi:hypothetical protein
VQNFFNWQMRAYYPLVALFFLSACAPATMTQLVAEGNAPLSANQLRELVTDQTLHLEAIDFDGRVQYLSDGHLRAESLQGGKDKGKWHITPEDQLCMKFDLWYYGDLKCYKLVKEKKQYVFFTANGARYYTGTSSAEHQEEPGAQSRLESSLIKEDSQQQLPAPRLSQAEKQQTLQRLARNCPGCNFAGVDLEGAQLIAANLAGANLAGANLSDANLRRANLAGANLNGAKLIRTNLAGADLSESDLSDADLTGSNLIRAKVNGAKFQGTTLTGAHLESIQGFKE